MFYVQFLSILKGKCFSSSQALNYIQSFKSTEDLVIRVSKTSGLDFFGMLIFEELSPVILPQLFSEPLPVLSG